MEWCWEWVYDTVVVSWRTSAAAPSTERGRKRQEEEEKKKKRKKKRQKTRLREVAHSEKARSFVFQLLE